MFNMLIKEVPADSEPEHAAIEWIMRHKKIVLVARTLVDMSHHHEETRVLDVHIGVYVHNGVVAHLHVLVSVPLYRILAQCRRIVWSLVARKVSHVGTKVDV